MIRLLVVQPGEKLTELAGYRGDFADWTLAGMGLASAAAQVVRPHRGEALPESAGAVLVTGSNAMVTDARPWIDATARWLVERVAGGTPVLGICFGHQLLAHALGGTVLDNPRGIEVGTVQARRLPGAAGDALFGDLPGVLAVQASHRQAVKRLPEGAVGLAASAKDPHHAFRFGASAWGVQFHPEFDARVTRAYTEHYRAELSAAGEDAGRLLDDVCETPVARLVLRAFGRLVGRLG